MAVRRRKKELRRRGISIVNRVCGIAIEECVKRTLLSCGCQMLWKDGVDRFHKNIGRLTCLCKLLDGLYNESQTFKRLPLVCQEQDAPLVLL